MGHITPDLSVSGLGNSMANKTYGFLFCPSLRGKQTNTAGCTHLGLGMVVGSTEKLQTRWVMGRGQGPHRLSLCSLWNSAQSVQLPAGTSMWASHTYPDQTGPKPKSPFHIRFKANLWGCAPLFSLTHHHIIHWQILLAVLGDHTRAWGGALAGAGHLPSVHEAGGS